MGICRSLSIVDGNDRGGYTDALAFSCSRDDRKYADALGLLTVTTAGGYTDALAF
jgi:hypothetical protein